MIDSFDTFSLAGNRMFQDVARTSMRKVGPKVVMQLKRAAPTLEAGDQSIAYAAIDALGSMLWPLGINIGGNHNNSMALSIEALIESLLASDAVQLSDPPITYEIIKAGVVDGSIRPAVDAVLYEFLKEMTGLGEMTPAAQASMEMGGSHE